jgi:hypothetical protein
MKKYLTASLLAACLTVPAFASNSKLAVRSPDEPLHRSAIALCIGLFVGLHAYKRRLKREELLLAAFKR